MRHRERGTNQSLEPWLSIEADKQKPTSFLLHQEETTFLAKSS